MRKPWDVVVPLGLLGVVAVGGMMNDMRLRWDWFGGSSGCLENDVPWALVDQAEAAVKADLRSPSTARFPEKWEGGGIRFSAQPGCVYDLYGMVDSQNGFGAMLRASWHVHATPRAGFDKFNVEVKSVVTQ